MTNPFITPCNPQLKWREAYKELAIYFSPRCTYTPHTNFTVAWKLLLHGAHYHLISIQSSQLKLYRGCISLPELGAICRPLSCYLYQWRCVWGEHLGFRRQSMKCPWLPALLFVQKRPKGIWTTNIVKKQVSTDCKKMVWDPNSNRIWIEKNIYSNLLTGCTFKKSFINWMQKWNGISIIFSQCECGFENPVSSVNMFYSFLNSEDYLNAKCSLMNSP